MKNNFYRNDPRIITCKFSSRCEETQQLIHKGQKALYYPLTRKVFSLSSQQAVEFGKWKADIDLGYNY